MRLKYNGPLMDGVEIPELGREGENAVKHGEIVEVDNDLGKRLAENSDWQVTSRSGSTKKDGGDE